MLRAFEIGFVMISVLALFSVPLAFSDPHDDSHDDSHNNSSVICIGVLPPGIHEKVVVPKGETCTISGASLVLKNVKVQKGATLLVFAGVINGNIDLKKESNLYMFEGIVGKSVKGKQTDNVIIAEGSQVKKVSITKGTGETAIVDSVIEKNVKISKQKDGFVFIKDNEIGGNLKVEKGDTEISSFIKSNIIGGNLDCKKNSPPPLSEGFINTVSGDKKHQCSADLGF